MPLCSILRLACILQGNLLLLGLSECKHTVSGVHVELAGLVLEGFDSAVHDLLRVTVPDQQNFLLPGALSNTKWDRKHDKKTSIP